MINKLWTWLIIGVLSGTIIFLSIKLGKDSEVIKKLQANLSKIKENKKNTEKIEKEYEKVEDANDAIDRLDEISIDKKRKPRKKSLKQKEEDGQ